MSDTRRKKLLGGMLTAFPLLIIPTVHMSLFVTMIQVQDGKPVLLDPPMWLQAAAIGTVLLLFGLIAYYIGYIRTSGRVPQEKRSLWIVVILLANFIAMPIFWYHYVWRADS